MELTAKIIQKYSKYSVAQLKAKAQRIFNAFIRKRDEGKPCINCGKYRKLQAGHFYATSTHPHLRFNEINVNGECLHCNYYNSQSHAQGYGVRLREMLGEQKFKEFTQLANRKVGNKADRFLYIETICKYSNKK